jgi:hypothetical protein
MKTAIAWLRVTRGLSNVRFLRKVEELGVAAENKVARETLALLLNEQAAKK